MSFQNLYYKRAVATAKPCYVCLRDTNIVLSTADVVDFIYTCDNHLTDRGFATEIVDPEDAKAKASTEDIEKIKREYDEKQKLKRAKAQSKASTSDASSSKETNGAPERSPTQLSSASPPSISPSPSHRRFALHRQYFAMRQDIHRRKESMAKLREVAPKLPRAPTSGLQ